MAKERVSLISFASLSLDEFEEQCSKRGSQLALDEAKPPAAFFLKNEDGQFIKREGKPGVGRCEEEGEA